MATVARVLTITQSNLDNDYISLAEVLDFFPDDAVGGQNSTEAAPRKVRIQWGEEVVETDIDGSKKIFRARRWVGQFFEENRVRAGDRILLEQIETYDYRVSRI